MARIEDHRLITGKGKFTANIRPTEALVVKFLRSPIACGVILSIDTSKAKSLPGVVNIFTARDMAADGVTHMLDTAKPVRDDGGTVINPRRPILNSNDIKHLGEPIAIIIAQIMAIVNLI